MLLVVCFVRIFRFSIVSSRWCLRAPCYRMLCRPLNIFIRINKLSASCFGPYRMHAMHRCGLLLQMSHVAWSVSLFVCLSVFWSQGCAVQKWLNHLRCHFGVKSYWSKELLCIGYPSQFIEDNPTMSNPLTFSGIISLFIMCIGIIRNNSLVDGRARAEWNPGH